MQNSCDCSNCPHQCGSEDEDETVNTLAEKKAQNLIASLKKDIQALGFKTEDTEDGIKVSN